MTLSPIEKRLRELFPLSIGKISLRFDNIFNYKFL